MATLINEIKEFASGSSAANIDNHVFRAFYVFTSGLLLAASGILITSQFFGDTIDCIADGAYSRSDAAKKSIDNFCWVSATYTVPELYGSDSIIGATKIDEGVGQFDPQIHTQRFQLYYRWISLLLIIKAVLFYSPHYFWKNWEGGKMAGLTGDTMLNVPVEPTLDGDRRRARIELLLDYLQAYGTNSHNYYTYRMYACEVGNLIILAFNIFLTNWVTDELFLKIGEDFIETGYYSKILLHIFPMQAKCLWRYTGPSGSIQNFDALCLLPLNSFNKVLFAILWFWYMILGVVTIGWLLFRLLTIFVPVRSSILRWKACAVNCEGHNHPNGTDCIDYICKTLPHEEWLVITQLSENVDPVVIISILGGLCERLLHMARRRRSTKPFIIRTDEDSLILNNGKVLFNENDG